MKKILITGCAGFIGSNLIDYLFKMDNNLIIIGIDNFDNFYDKSIKTKNMQFFISHKNFIFKEIDLSEQLSYKDLPMVDLVIHLAAKAGVRPSIEKPAGYILHNIVATNLLLNWMKDFNIKKYIFASSSSVYGNNTKIPFSENDPVDNAISPYAFTKKSCEILNYTYYHLYQIDCINLRFFTVYGPRQRPDLAINKFVHQIEHNKPIEVYGNGDTERDYTYIDDIIQGIYKSIEYILSKNFIFETINLGNQHPIKLIDLITTIQNELGIKAILHFTNMQEGDVNRTFADISKAKKLLSYKPETDFVNGLKKYILWKKNN